jgi:hypothetical protein
MISHAILQGKTTPAPMYAGRSSTRFSCDRTKLVSVERCHKCPNSSFFYPAAAPEVLWITECFYTIQAPRCKWEMSPCYRMRITIYYANHKTPKFEVRTFRQRIVACATGSRTVLAPVGLSQPCVKTSCWRLCQRLARFVFGKRGEPPSPEPTLALEARSCCRRMRM